MQRRMPVTARRNAAVLIAVLVTAAPPWAAAAVVSDWVDGHNSRIRLVAGAHGEAAKAAIVAGIELRIADGWKTYWRMPGDAGGIPPHFDWTGSVNVKTLKVLYPAPSRHRDAAGSTIGYKGAVVFPVEIEPLDATKPVELRLAAEYGICRDICIPAEAKLTLMVPPRLEAGPVPAEVAAATARVPRASTVLRAGDPRLTSVSAVLEGAKPSLTIIAEFPAGAAGADLFLEAPEGIFVPLPKVPAAVTGKTVRFEVDLSDGVDPKDIKGRELTLTLISEAGQSEFVWKAP